MNRKTVLLVCTILNISSILFSKGVKGNKSKGEDLIGEWKWKLITTVFEDGKKSFQNAYVPGIKADHYMKFYKDGTLEAIDIAPRLKPMVSNGKWQVIKDTLKYNVGFRNFVMKYYADRNSLNLIYIKVSEHAYLKEYSKEKNKVIEEYEKQ